MLTACGADNANVNGGNEAVEIVKQEDVVSDDSRDDSLLEDVSNTIDEFVQEGALEIAAENADADVSVANVDTKDYKAWIEAIPEDQRGNILDVVERYLNAEQKGQIESLDYMNGESIRDLLYFKN